MKKLFTLLLVTLCFWSSTINAQDTTCNAGFHITYQNANTLQFHPITIGQPLSQHYWNFGDGTYSNEVFPVHTYFNGSVFTVYHTIVGYNGGAIYCNDSAFMTVQVQTTTPCNLVASFTSTQISYNSFHFQNNSTPLSSTDSIRWTFGDGSTSNQVSPNHTFITPGYYIACLRIQQRDSLGILTNCVSETCDTVFVQGTGNCNLTANFYSYQDTTTSNPFTYHFQNTTVPLHNTDSIRWIFGDGTESYQVNPDHVYAQPGTYTVCLRVQQRDSLGNLTSCISEMCHVITVVQITTCNLTANFYSYQDTTVANPYTYQFVNTSFVLLSTDSIRWTFGDGWTSSLANPTHTYAQPGTYTVCLRVQRRDSLGILYNCVSEICHVVIVQPGTTACTLVANFYSFQDSTSTNYTYHFENTSAPLNAYDSIRWTFGDGTSSNQISPNHTYTQSGTYTVCLRVQKRGPNGVGLTNCISEICHTVTIAYTCSVHSNFTWTTDSLNPHTIYFTNLSSPANAGATILWNLGDGNTTTVWNPVHTYNQAGNYQVCLYIQTSSTCIDYHCFFVTVTNPPVNCQHQSDFNFTVSGNNSQLINFTPLNVNTNAQYTWTFGDGTGNHDITTTHLYAQPGNYTGCLTVYQNANCASTTCRPIPVTYQPNCDSVIVSYTYHADSTAPNKLYFQAVSNYTLTDQTWTIYSGYTGALIATIHQNNPQFVFSDTGSYYVCLKAVTNTGCTKNYCNYVYINHVPGTNACNLQPYPNPATNLLSFNVSLTQTQMIYVYVYSVLNVMVLQKNQQGFAGSNLVLLSLNNLGPGVYTMKVIHGNDICYAQFIKL